MSDDVFGQLCFFTFVLVPTGASTSREKRVKLATVHCRRSECDEYFAAFKIDNGDIARKVCAEFSFREML